MCNMRKTSLEIFSRNESRMRKDADRIIKQICRVVHRSSDGAIVCKINGSGTFSLSRQKFDSTYLMFWIYSLRMSLWTNQIKQMSSLVQLHRRFGYLNYDNVNHIAKFLKSGIEVDEHRRPKCITFAESQQTKSNQSQKDTGENSPTKRIGGVVCSNLKGSITY